MAKIINLKPKVKQDHKLGPYESAEGMIYVTVSPELDITFEVRVLRVSLCNFTLKRAVVHRLLGDIRKAVK